MQELDDEEYKAKRIKDDDSKVGDSVSWALTTNILDILHYAAICPEEQECYVLYSKQKWFFLAIEIIWTISLVLPQRDADRFSLYN